MDLFEGFSNRRICISIGKFIDGDVAPVSKSFGINIAEVDEAIDPESEEREFLQESILDAAFRTMLETERCVRYNSKEFHKFSQEFYGKNHVRLNRRMNISQTTLTLMESLYEDVKGLAQTYMSDPKNIKRAMKSLSAMKIDFRYMPVVMFMDSSVRPTVFNTGLTAPILRNSVKCKNKYWYDEDADILAITWEKLMEKIGDGSINGCNFYFGLV